MNHGQIKSNEDLIVGKTDYDPMGNMIYEAKFGKLTLWCAVAGGILLGVLAYLIASGTMPIRDFGQFSTSGNGVATFVGTIIGVAVGGFTGSMIGLNDIVKYNENKNANNGKNEKHK